MTNEEAIAVLKEKYCGIGSNDLFVFRKAIEALELEKHIKENRTASIFDYVRMCKCFVDSCEGCPLKKRTGPCPPLDFSEENNKAVLKWCDEHPIRTYAKDFLEKFPNAEISLRDIPYGICRYRVYNGGKNRPCGTLGRFDCDACWNETMKEEKPNAEQ